MHLVLRRAHSTALFSFSKSFYIYLSSKLIHSPCHMFIVCLLACLPVSCDHNPAYDRMIGVRFLQLGSVV